MRILKRILTILAVMVIVILIAALFMKKEYTVERSVTINKPKAEVYEYVKYLKNQNEYSKWAQMDPAMEKTFTGTDGQPGFVSAWKSNKEEVGAGEQEIVAMKDGERIDYEIRFKEPFESNADSYMTTTSVSEQETEVKWGFHGKMPYPMNFMQVFFDMDEMIGADLSTGLNNLKAKMES